MINLSRFLISGFSDLHEQTVFEYLENYAHILHIAFNPIHNTFRVKSCSDEFELPLFLEYASFCRFASEQLCSFDQRMLYSFFLDPYDMLLRLGKSEVPGVIDANFEIRMADGSYHVAKHVLINDYANGVEDGMVHLFVYDIDAIAKHVEAHTPTDPPVHHVDSLTGILRGGNFFEQIPDFLRRVGAGFCIAAIDIENFILFNKWYGRSAGQQVLALIGQILIQTANEVPLLGGYLGQDDFAVVIPFDIVIIRKLYERIHSLLRRYDRSGGFLPTIGICPLPGDLEKLPVMDLYDNALRAMKPIKGTFSRRVSLYNPLLHRKKDDGYQLLAEFQNALKEGEITFYLQPQCRISTEQIVGAESLARWIKKDGTIIMPTEFIPHLERTGFISMLDQHIWEQVCIFLESLVKRGIHPVPISVNLSPVDIRSFDVVRYLVDLVKTYHLQPSYLKIEITETAYASTFDEINETAQALRRAGFQVLMDDFGSGYSSLNMLRDLNIDILKLDTQFMRISSGNEVRGINIIESIVNLARNMDLPIIIEGAETEFQLSFLRDLGCRYLQSYYFYSPMPAEQFEQLLIAASKIDYAGFQARTIEAVHIREFLDENIFSDAMLNNILGPVAFYNLKDEHLDIVRYNDQFRRMINDEGMDHRTISIQNYVYAEDVPILFSLLAEAEAERLQGASGLIRFYKENGGVYWYSMHFFYLESSDFGKRFYGSINDVTELQTLKTDKGNIFVSGSHATQAEIYAEMLEAQASGIIVYDMSTELVVYMNPSGEKMFHVDKPEGEAFPISELLTQGDPQMAKQLTEKVSHLQPNESIAYDLELLQEDGSTLYLHATTKMVIPESGTKLLITSLMDNSSHKFLEAELYQQSQIDALTGLYNRGAGERRIDEALTSREYALFCLMDIDSFKAINDNYGHAIGDFALIRLAECIKDSIRDNDISMRLGGDEFAVYARGIRTPEVAELIISRLYNEIEAVTLPENDDVHLSVSLGAVLLPEDHPYTFDEVYRSTDDLMYLCKKEGCGVYKIRTLD